jgi:DNA (cytosine-5)-methyltransferase 1
MTPDDTPTPASASTPERVTSALRVLSLFSGIGGIDLAAEWAGMRVVGQVEIDPFCQTVLARHWPQVRRMADIREVRGDEFGTIDVVVAGFPCQPASVAGQRRGADDPRWLWPETLRVIGLYQPTWTLLENVPGLISLGLDTVLSDLDAANYAAWPLLLPAAAVGAPHLRERVFIIGHHDMADTNQHNGRRARRAGRGDVDGATGADAAREGHPQRPAVECGRADVAHASSRGIRRRWTPQSCGQPPRGRQGSDRGNSAHGEDVPHAGSTRLEGHGTRASTGQPRQTQPRMGGAVDGLSGGLDGTGCARHRWPSGPGEPQAPWEAPRTVAGVVRDRERRLKALGNAVVPQQVYPILAAIAAAHAADTRGDERP